MPSFLITLIVFVIILSVLVLTHEFGHFIIARKNGVEVEEFGFGIPPKLLGKKVGDTVYSINLFPFGGFVKLKGEDPDEISPQDLNDPKSFVSKTPGQRISILIAGVVMNVILGIFLYYTLFALNNNSSLTLPMLFDYDFPFGRQETINTTVMGFVEGSPAEEYGVELGEAVLEVDGQAVYSVADVRRVLADKAGQEVKLLLMDLRQVSRPYRVTTVVPMQGEDGGMLGVILSKSVVLHYDESKRQKVFSGFLHTYNITAYSTKTLSSLVALSVAEKDISPVSDSVSGPVGIFSVISSIFKYAGDKAYLNIIDLTALMAISLAIVNLLPLPALDGGRLFFVLIEKIRGKPVKAAIESLVHRVGMLVLLSLLILVSVREALRLF